MHAVVKPSSARSLLALALVATAVGSVLPAEAVEVTFRFRPSPGAATVSVAGSFNGWNTGANPMTDPDGDGVYEIILDLSPGKHPYKFVVNGTDWITDETASEFSDDGFGGKNSVLTVGSDPVLVGEAAADGEGAGGGASPTGSGKDTPVTFRFRPGIEGVNAVSVAGAFNEWNAAADVMNDDDGDGVWEAVVRLEPGRYAYQYVVDGDRWVTDGSASEHEDDGFGGRNAVVVVGAAAMVVGSRGSLRRGGRR